MKADVPYLKSLVDDIHSTTIATIGADGHPQSRVIDITKKLVVIDQHHCLHCGRCAETCPKQVIEKRV